MRTYENPFKSRAAEQQRDILGFLRYVGAGALDLLPASLWDRPLIIRSAPGGGKTTLMRIFSAESLAEVHSRRDDFSDLAQRLEAHTAIDNRGPLRLGVMLNLSRDYKTIANSGAPQEIASRLFFRLLDARIASATVRAALVCIKGSYPSDAHRVELRPRDSSSSATEAMALRLGGFRGDQIVKGTRTAEREIGDLVDSLLPVDWAAVSRGHAELYSLRLLSEVDVVVDGRAIEAQPLVLLDDGHELTSNQRDALLGALLDRSITVARWYAERFEALRVEELLQDDTAGRDYELLELERATRDVSVGRRRFDRLLREVGNLRASWHLERYTHGARDFFQYLEDPGGDIPEAAVGEVRARTGRLAGSNPHYLKWLEEADQGQSYERIIRIRAAEIIIERYLRRPQQTLFDSPTTDAFDALLKSDIKEAARLLVSREQKLPYYAGADIVVSLASQNVEQFLRVCGELFDHMIGKLTLDESPIITAQRQHLIVRRASDTYWRELSARLPLSSDVLQLLNRIVTISTAETDRPTAPYAPGVNGIAISMSDRARLLDSSARSKIPGADRLYAALAVAVSRNVLVAEPNYSVKKTRVMVLYLNRLLCPRYFLPLQRGSFRERTLAEVAGWLLDPVATPEPDPMVLF